ncbi:hypothetical protein HN695_05205 [Candidatus Woesearchaeota archaeon]|jgi:hypothetical protein|nr:hypothetical protein [Candidatus Woesearchaeota archaeon]MBT5272529.1 hypothetical protein [Candidatus Woesearchaeota archaeon]MBT6041463.1 hypothetical protein [Candidatus Woesearchaeota archaeon]MBT6336391.1 hypothetical protein [Candidatus Woesearchaeota archaeon]MBT7927712.1 hypothetical protein [Candidatus Woesearchaeota archaeon]
MIPIDDLVVPEGFRIETVDHKDYNTHILAVPGYDINKPIEIDVDKTAREGVLLASVKIPGVGYFISGFGGNSEQAAYRAFKKMEEIKNGAGYPFSKTDLEAITERYISSRLH